MLSPNDFIKYIITNSVSAYKTRYAVLYHICFVSGNGIFWDKNGKLNSPDIVDDPFSDSEITTCNELKSFFSNSPDLVSQLDLKIKYLTAQLEFKKKHIDLIANNFFYFEDSQKPCYSQARLRWLTPNSLIDNMPNNADSEWVFVIKDFFCQITHDLRATYCTINEVGELEWNDERALKVHNNLVSFLSR